MRKNDVRKWIHAGLDLLPLLIIPIFALAVRSDNNFQIIEVTEDIGKVQEHFNQNVKNGNFADNLNYWNTSTGVTASVTDGVCSFTSTAQYRGVNQNYYFVADHIYLCEASILTDTTTTGATGVILQLSFPNQTRYQSCSVSNDWQRLSFTASFTVSDWGNIIVQDNRPSNFSEIKFTDVVLYDLTYMFGDGFEPSIDQFNSWFTDNYYDYTLDRNIYIPNYDTVVFNDTDVGSQMIYTLYNSCDKYFNFNNVFNFNDIYQWLEINVFGGTAPLSAFIAWNIFLYEFIMDLIFLLYALFMFFIDFCTNLIDRFHTKCSGGR